MTSHALRRCQESFSHAGQSRKTIMGLQSLPLLSLAVLCVAAGLMGALIIPPVSTTSTQHATCANTLMHCYVSCNANMHAMYTKLQRLRFA